MSNTTSQVSVIMPVYNGAKTIKLALDSLLYQSYSNWTCVVVNDGSIDQTKDILDSLSDPRFVVIHLQQNKGRGYARQVALDHAAGDYLTYLDADDFYHPDKLKFQVDFLNENPDVFLVSCGQVSFDNKFNIRTVRGKKYPGIHKYKFGNVLKIVPVTSMVRLQHAKTIKYNKKLDASEDVDFFSKYLDNRDYCIIKDLLYYYCEYESVSYFKTLEYSYYDFLRELSMFSRVKLKSIKLMTSTLFKAAIYAVMMPFLGKDFFLKCRGRKPLQSEIEEFNNQLAHLRCFMS